VLETIKGYYKAIAGRVLEVEKALKGKSGEEKKAAVIDYIANLIDIPYIPAFIENPAKKAAIGFAVDYIVEKFNVITDWNFADAEVSNEALIKLAGIADKPIAVLLDDPKAIPSAATIDEKINAAVAKYDSLQADEAWDKSIAFAERWEGGKNYKGDAEGVHTMINKADKGGPTDRGITLPTLAAAYQQGVISHCDLDKLTKEDARAIYKKNYWDRYGWGDLPFPVCLCALDCSINHGGFAWILQRAVCQNKAAVLTIDGKYGPATRAALKTVAKTWPQELAEAICVERKKYYDNIVADDPGQKANLKGWYNRVKAMAEAAGVKSPV
jgi:hypothetical protein